MLGGTGTAAATFGAGMGASEVLDSIERAFDGVPRPDTSLRHFSLTDRKGMSGSFTREEWLEAGAQRIDDKWQDIPDSEIAECQCVLAHMEAPEFQYFLPAYMRYSVRHVDTPIWKSDILGGTVFSLYPSTKDIGLRHYNLAQFSLFTGAQRHAIGEFLRFVAENAGFVQRPDALKALERHWTDKVIRDGFDTSVLVLPK